MVLLNIVFKFKAYRMQMYIIVDCDKKLVICMWAWLTFYIMTILDFETLFFLPH
jgi:hypothetical protein